jgi:hypothetical protein
VVNAAQQEKQDPISEVARTKMAGGMSQVVGNLPSKHKVLNANSRTVKKKKKKKKK